MRSIFAFVMMLIFSTPVMAQETCLKSDLDSKIAALMQETTPESLRVQATKQVEIGVAKGIVRAEGKDDLIAVIIEYVTRKNAGCAIPPILSGRVSRALAIIPAGGEPCPDGQFDKIIERQFGVLKASNGFGVFESVIKQQIAENVIPSAKQRFTEKWDSNQGFRERVIKAGLQLNVMYTNKCTNLPDPILSIIAEF